MKKRFLRHLALLFVIVLLLRAYHYYEIERISLMLEPVQPQPNNYVAGLLMIEQQNNNNSTKKRNNTSGMATDDVKPSNNNNNSDEKMIQKTVSKRSTTRPNLSIRNREWKASDLEGLKILKFGDRPYFQRGWDDSPVVVPTHKLVFWTTPKVACTTFKKLLRRMAGYHNWRRSPHDPTSNGLTYLYDYPPEEADRMLTDPSWTRAVFVREPKERFLSAYLEKAVSNAGQHVRTFCCHHRRLKQLLDCRKKANHSVATFPEFTYQVAPLCHDPHWESQKHHIPDHYWTVINFVGHFETARADSERLLRKINAWEEYGATGWSTAGGGMFDVNTAGHATHATTKMQKFYNSSALKEFVEQLYRMDYEFPLFNFSKT